MSTLFWLIFVTCLTLWPNNKVTLLGTIKVNQTNKKFAHKKGKPCIFHQFSVEINDENGKKGWRRCCCWKEVKDFECAFKSFLFYYYDFNGCMHKNENLIE